MESSTVQIGNCMRLIVHLKLKPVLHAESSAGTLRLASVSYFMSFVTCVKPKLADGTRQLASS